MPIGKRGKRQKDRIAQESQPVTRRQFLKEASMVVGGAAIASLALTSACSSPENSSTTMGTTTTTGTPANTTNATSSTPTPTTTTENITNTTSTTVHTSTITWNGSYTPPLKRPEMEPIPGCSTFVAMDRLYAMEHMWVKLIADGVVAIGITEKFQQFLEEVYSIKLQDVSTVLYRDSYLGSVEAKKMNVEFIAPVSGTVLQNNGRVFDDPELMDLSPYNRGWLQVIQLSNPDELNELLTAEKYISYNAKIVVE